MPPFWRPPRQNGGYGFSFCRFIVDLFHFSASFSPFIVDSASFVCFLIKGSNSCNSIPSGIQISFVTAVVNVRFPQTPLTRFLQIYANLCKFLQIRGRYRCAGMLARGKRRYANEQSPETNLASPLAANIWLVGRLFDLFKLNIFKLIWLDDFEVDL